MLKLAEGEGFKPPIPERGIPDFESSAFGHSANLPFPFADAKVVQIFESTKFIIDKSHSKKFAKPLTQLFRLTLADRETYLACRVEGL